MPSDSEFERFYESDYYDLLRKGGRAPELRRLMTGGEEADRERDWLREQMYADISAELTGAGSGKNVLDVGCGQGELIQWLTEQGFQPHGIEPSDEAAALARERGLDVRSATLEDLLADSEPPPTYDAVLLLNVLEHVPDAPAMLRGISRLLEPGGLLYIRVPNDFNPLQLAAQEKLDAEPWWIAVPDHVNYFSVDSLVSVCGQLGFEPVDIQADFPMELFLLMGRNYVGNPDVGSVCHAERVEAERSMPSDVRRNMFRSFAAAGIGRDSRVLVRKATGVVAEPRSAGLPVDRDGYKFDLLARADIETLRGFRNAQMEVLRQTRVITQVGQQQWFANHVEPAHAAEKPLQLLIGIHCDAAFIGYGGLTNLNWDAGRAEVSFLVDPERAADPDVYRRDMTAFLAFLADWSFGTLGLHRLFAETYVFRDFHISLLEGAGYRLEGRLRQHVMTPDGLGDSLVHGLLASEWRAP